MTAPHTIDKDDSARDIRWRAVHDTTHWEGVDDIVSEDDVRHALGLSQRVHVLLHEVSEFGYDRTFKLSCLHPHGGVEHFCLRAFGCSDNQIRQRTAADAFAPAQCTPPPLVCGDRWALEPWLGAAFEVSKHTNCDFRAVGQLLALVHSRVDPTWFDEHYDEIVTDAPVLQTLCAADLSPHAMVRLRGGAALDPHQKDGAQYRMMLDPANATLLREWCLAGSLLPRHPLARRLVSLHGDMHAGNVVRCAQAPAKLALVDLELACVGHAVFDISYALEQIVRAHVTGSSGTGESVFLLSYIEASGEPPPSAQELSDLRLDCLIFYHCSRYLRLSALPATPAACMLIVKYVHEHARALRESEPSASELLRHPCPGAHIDDTLGVAVRSLGGLCKRDAGPVHTATPEANSGKT